LACLAGLLTLAAGLGGCAAAPDDPEAGVVENARRAFLDGRFLTAEEAYQQYLQAYPRGTHRLEAWQRLADIAQDGRESPAEAATLLEAALLEFGREPAAASDLLARCGEVRLRRKEYDKAAAHYTALLGLPGVADARRQEAYLQLARCSVWAGDQAGALASYETCAQDRLAGPLRARCTLARAELLARLDKAGQAEALLRGLYDDPALPAPLRGQAGFDWAMLLEARNDGAAALALYEAVRGLHANPMVVDKRLGYLRADRSGQAGDPGEKPASGR